MVTGYLVSNKLLVVVVMIAVAHEGWFVVGEILVDGYWLLRLLICW